MKIAIDASPLKSGHQFRGVGKYTRSLLETLEKTDKKNEYFRNVESKTIKKADIVHYPYFSPFFLTLPLVKKKKLVVTIHDLTPLVFPKNYPPGVKGRIRFQIQKFLVQKADAVITDSEASRKDILEFLKIPPEKVHVIYLAVSRRFRQISLSDSKVKAVKKKYCLSDKFVLYVGDVNYNKNIKGLVGACEKVNLPLVIVGKQAKEENIDRNHPENRDLVWLQDKAKEQPLITILGFVPDEDLVALYNLATVYCQPSLYEGFGLPVLEAMACGCPVVAANTSSLPEVCGRAALLVDPKVSGLVGAIRSVLNDSKLRNSLIEKGFYQVKKFSWQKTARETIKIYEKVFNG